MPYPVIDFSRVRTYSILQRQNRVAIDDLITPQTPLPAYESPELAAVAERIIAARRAGAPSSG